MTLRKKLTKIGNSMGLIFPADLLKAAGLDEDGEVQMTLEGERIIIEPVNLKDHKVMKTFLSVLKDYDQTFKKLAK